MEFTTLVEIVIRLNPRKFVGLCSAVCSALTELVVNDTNGQQIVQVSGLLLFFFFKVTVGFF